MNNTFSFSVLFSGQVDIVSSQVNGCEGKELSLIDSFIISKGRKSDTCLTGSSLTGSCDDSAEAGQQASVCPAADGESSLNMADYLCHYVSRATADSEAGKQISSTLEVLSMNSWRRRHRRQSSLPEAGAAAGIADTDSGASSTSGASGAGSAGSEPGAAAAAAAAAVAAGAGGAADAQGRQGTGGSEDVERSCHCQAKLVITISDSHELSVSSPDREMEQLLTSSDQDLVYSMLLHPVLECIEQDSESIVREHKGPLRTERSVRVNGPDGISPGSSTVVRSSCSLMAAKAAGGTNGSDGADETGLCHSDEFISRSHHLIFVIGHELYLQLAALHASRDGAGPDSASGPEREAAMAYDLREGGQLNKLYGLLTQLGSQGRRADCMVLWPDEEYQALRNAAAVRTAEAVAQDRKCSLADEVAALTAVAEELGIDDLGDFKTKFGFRDDHDIVSFLSRAGLFTMAALHREDALIMANAGLKKKAGFHDEHADSQESGSSEHGESKTMPGAHKAQGRDTSAAGDAEADACACGVGTGLAGCDGGACGSSAGSGSAGGAALHAAGADCGDMARADLTLDDLPLVLKFGSGDEVSEVRFFHARADALADDLKAAVKEKCRENGRERNCQKEYDYWRFVRYSMRNILVLSHARSEAMLISPEYISCTFNGHECTVPLLFCYEHEFVDLLRLPSFECTDTGTMDVLSLIMPVSELPLCRNLIGAGDLSSFIRALRLNDSHQREDVEHLLAMLRPVGSCRELVQLSDFMRSAGCGLRVSLDCFEPHMRPVVLRLKYQFTISFMGTFEEQLREFMSALSIREFEWFDEVVDFKRILDTSGFHVNLAGHRGLAWLHVVNTVRLIITHQWPETAPVFQDGYFKLHLEHDGYFYSICSWHDYNLDYSSLLRPDAVRDSQGQSRGAHFVIKAHSKDGDSNTEENSREENGSGQEQGCSDNEAAAERGADEQMAVKPGAELYDAMAASLLDDNRTGTVMDQSGVKALIYIDSAIKGLLTPYKTEELVWVLYRMSGELVSRYSWMLLDRSCFSRKDIVPLGTPLAIMDAEFVTANHHNLRQAAGKRTIVIAHAVLKALAWRKTSGNVALALMAAKAQRAIMELGDDVVFYKPFTCSAWHSFGERKLRFNMPVKHNMACLTTALCLQVYDVVLFTGSKSTVRAAEKCGVRAVYHNGIEYAYHKAVQEARRYYSPEFPVSRAVSSTDPEGEQPHGKADGRKTQNLSGTKGYDGNRTCTTYKQAIESTNVYTNEHAEVLTDLTADELSWTMNIEEKYRIHTVQPEDSLANKLWKGRLDDAYSDYLHLCNDMRGWLTEDDARELGYDRGLGWHYVCKAATNVRCKRFFRCECVADIVEFNEFFSSKYLFSQKGRNEPGMFSVPDPWEIFRLYFVAPRKGRNNFSRLFLKESYLRPTTARK